MKKVIRLTESDLARIVRRVINEAPTSEGYQTIRVQPTVRLKNAAYAPNEVATGDGEFFCFSCVGVDGLYKKGTYGRIESYTVTPTKLATDLGLTEQSLQIKVPAQTLQGANFTRGKAALFGPGPNQMQAIDKKNQIGYYTWTLKTPAKYWKNTTGKVQDLFNVTLNTNDYNNREQNVVFKIGATEFGKTGVKAN